MASETGYTIAEVRERVGCSDSWVRKHLRKGTFGDVEKVHGPFGVEYRFTPEQVEHAENLYAGKRTGTGDVGPSRSDLTALVVQARAEVETWQTIAAERGERLQALEEQTRIDRERIERLLSLSLWDRMRGKHRQV